tara:strand:+ start:642 stop:908 length:267 start_codon:yes stop_codon:yes gene_type:complete
MAEKSNHTVHVLSGEELDEVDRVLLQLLELLSGQSGPVVVLGASKKALAVALATTCKTADLSDPEERRVYVEEFLSDMPRLVEAVLVN